MTQQISGPGIGLPPPQTLYPAQLSSVPYTAATNKVTLNSGDTLVIPAGRWWVQHDGYSLLQYLDPVTGSWLGYSTARSGPQMIQSDGFTIRVANLTSCPVAAVVTNQGSGYAQATTTVTPTVGNSTWQAVVGGAISTTVTVTSGGSGYSIAPIVFFPAPPSPGVQATGYATISGGAVTGVTVTNQGAGYKTAPTPVFVPSPFDPNIGSITAATATTTISANAGKLCAVICTNSGDPVASMPSLTIAGAGSSAAATAVVLYTIASATGSGGANFTDGQNIATTTGGVTSASAALTNPAIELTTFYPRPAVGVPTISGGAVSGFTFTDTGLFTSSNLSSNLPKLLVLAQTGSTDPSGALTLAPTLGGTQSIVTIQPV